MAPALGAGYRRFESSRPEKQETYGHRRSFVFIGLNEDSKRAIVKRSGRIAFAARWPAAGPTKGRRKGESSRPKDNEVGFREDSNPSWNFFNLSLS